MSENGQQPESNGQQGDNDGRSTSSGGDNNVRSHPAFKAVTSQVERERARAEAAEKQLAEIQATAAREAEKREIEAAKARGDYEGALAKEREAFEQNHAKLEQELAVERLGRQKDQLVGKLVAAGARGIDVADYLAQKWFAQDQETRSSMDDFVADAAANENFTTFFNASPGRMPVPGDTTGAASQRSSGMSFEAAAKDPSKVDASEMLELTRAQFHKVTGG